MKNFIFFIIDAMTEAYVDIDKDYSPTPFIDSMKQNGIYCSNIYSQGPYTEAALTPFYTGLDNLSNGGNFFRGNEVDKTTFEILEENGYDVLCYTQPLIYPKTMGRGINEERYGVSYFISAVWDYRLSYYKDLYLNNKINDKDYEKLYELLDSNFVFAIKSINEHDQNSFKYDFINKYACEYDSNKNKKILEEEYYKFLMNKKDYIISLFNEGLSHRLFTVEKIDMSNKANNEDIYKNIYAKYNKLFNKISKMNKNSPSNNKYNFIRTILKLMGSTLKLDFKNNKNLLKKYYYYRRLCSTKKELNEMYNKRGNYKPEPSFMKYYEHFKGWLDNRNSDKPFFCMMHVSDLHTPEIFFSIDSMNQNEIEEELDVMEKYIDCLPKNFKGNIIYLLSMRFIDLCVERIIADFSKSKYYKDTVILLSADHGSSFRLWPIRNQIVNNLHFENYKIPFVIYNYEYDKFKNENFYSTKDMMKTVLSIANIKNDLPGKNIINNEESDYMITEYLGGGCPDIYRREIQFAYRDSDYSIFAKQSIDAKSLDVFAVYDRRNDYFEEKNLIKKIDLKSIDNKIELITKRYYQIKKMIKNS